MDTYSKRNIERVKSLAQEMRYKHDAMDWGASPKFLIKKEGLDYNEYNLNCDNYLRKYITEPLKRISKTISAAFVVKEHIVLIDEDLHDAKKPFGRAHELGHHGIPEHREILYVCSEHDLNVETRNEMEFEANVFASEILYPTPLMESIHSNFPLSMDTILHLHNLSGGSIHSSALKYVNSSDKTCCLLILEKCNNEDGDSGLKLVKQIPSKKWVTTHGPKYLKDGQFLPNNHTLSEIVFSSSRDDVKKGEIEVTNTKKRFKFESFFNSYIAFALLFIES